MSDQWICFGEQKESVCLFVPDPLVIRGQYSTASGETTPYWAQVWPAAQGLYRFLTLHSGYISNKTIIELAAGLGLPSLFAARYAASVLCSDYDPEAVNYCRRSAAAAGLNNFEAAILDWNNLPASLHADVVMLSDVNYEPAEFDRLSQVFERLLEMGTTILLSSPQRLMAKPFIAQWLPWCIEQEEFLVSSQGATHAISVFVLSTSG